jgi:DNA-3-methyladenine glycosylase
MKLPREFYLRTDVVQLAREMLGMRLVTQMDGVRTSGIITETEAYAGVDDRASHAFGGRRTARTETMFLEGGRSYVYLCYGIHSLFNVVTGPAGVPHAVLIRSIEPVDGVDVILRRRNATALRPQLCTGPGKVCSALGLHFKAHDGLDLLGDTVWLEQTGPVPTDACIATGPRIGVDYAGQDALLPYRFVLKRKTADIQRP